MEIEKHKPKQPKKKKGPWNLIGFIPLDGPCGDAQVWRHHKKGIQALSSIDLVDGNLFWHVSVSSFPELGEPERALVDLAKVDFAMEGCHEEPPVALKAMHMYFPIGDTETTQ